MKILNIFYSFTFFTHSVLGSKGGLNSCKARNEEEPACIYLPPPRLGNIAGGAREEEYHRPRDISSTIPKQTSSGNNEALKMSIKKIKHKLTPQEGENVKHFIDKTYKDYFKETENIIKKLFNDKKDISNAIQRCDKQFNSTINELKENISNKLNACPSKKAEENISCECCNMFVLYALASNEDQKEINKTIQEYIVKIDKLYKENSLNFENLNSSIKEIETNFNKVTKLTVKKNEEKRNEDTNLTIKKSKEKRKNHKNPTTKINEKNATSTLRQQKIKMN